MGRPRGSGRIPVESRLRARVEIDGECWVWTGATINSGYGVIGMPTDDGGPYRNQLVHRVAYEEFKGRIPEGMQVDHLCKVRLCISPAHLEAVTPQENARRRDAEITHCRRAGHEYTPENTYMDRNGWKSCRACKNEKRRKPPISDSTRTLKSEWSAA